MNNETRHAMSKPSRFPAAAGALAGLLAAALGAWYLYPQHVGQPADAPAAGTAKEAMKPAPSNPAQHRYSREQVTAQLWALPEVQQWAAQVEKQSGGKWHAALIEYEQKTSVVRGVPYYDMTFVENMPERVVPWGVFHVSAADGTIFAEDAASGDWLTLPQWRAKEAASR